MGFFDFLKKKKEEIKIEKNEITLEELEHRVKEEEGKYKASGEEISKGIKIKVISLIGSLKTKNEVLKRVNLSGRKEEERLKVIVKENLYFYVNYVDKLIKDLEALRTGETEEYILNIHAVFDNFKKNSNKSFEKSTILVGKELEAISDTIRDFFSGLNNTVKENKDIFEKMRVLNRISGIKGDLIENKKVCSGIKKEIERLENEEKRIEGEKVKAEKEFIEFKESEIYKKYIAENEMRMKELSELDKEIFSVKERMNLKGMLKYFHSDVKKSRLILGYIENFVSGLAKDANLELAKMAEEVFKKDFMGELVKIKEKHEKLYQEKEKHAERKIESYESHIRNAEFDISRMKEEKEEEKKKLLRFEEKEGYLLEELNKKVSEVFGDVKITI